MGGGRTSEFSCRSTGCECVLIIGNSNFVLPVSGAVYGWGKNE